MMGMENQNMMDPSQMQTMREQMNKTGMMMGPMMGMTQGMTMPCMMVGNQTMMGIMPCMMGGQQWPMMEMGPMMGMNNK